MSQYVFGAGKWNGLAKLNEEAGEVVTEIGKLLMVSGSREHWSGDLVERLQNEIGDLSAAIEFVKRHCHELDRMKIEDRAQEKLNTFVRWAEDNDTN